MINLPNPCYNEKTHKSCVDRKCLCNKECEKWAAYVARRNELYAAADQARLSEEAYYDAARRRTAYIARKAGRKLYG